MALIDRRALIVGGAGTLATAGALAALGSDKEGSMGNSQARMPTAFVPHGGGPWPVLPLPMMRKAETHALAGYMKSIGEVPPTSPSALLVVSAHWEETVVTINNGPKPSMYYDYGGFPADAYDLQWPAPGDPALAENVYELIRKAGFQAAFDQDRGFDHGTFIPLMLAYPSANVPVVQVSLRRNLDPAEHLALGEALAPLRDRGVYILGSGNSYHNLRRFFSPSDTSRAESESFDQWLNHAIGQPRSQRDQLLSHWAQAPAARACHPREEHLIPLLVAAGAAGDDLGRVHWAGTMNGLKLSAHTFG